MYEEISLNTVKTKMYFNICLFNLSKVKEESDSNEKSIFPSNTGSSSGSCIDSKNWWANASSTLILLVGLRSSILSNKSTVSLVYPGKYSSKGVLAFDGKDSIYLRAYSLVICFFVSPSGVPLMLMIKLTYSM